jgi:hypothetical protein
MYKFLLIVFSLSIASGTLAASSNDPLVEAYNNISMEYVTCGAYFTIMSNALEKSNSEDASMKYGVAVENSMKYAILAAQQDRTLAQAEELTIEVYKQELEKLRQEISYNYDNISELINRHQSSCVLAMKRPETVLEKWLVEGPGN